MFKYTLFAIPLLMIFSVSIVPAIFNFIYTEDGKIGEWSDWSECGKTCGDSWQGRYRNCTKRAVGYGKSCPELGHFFETRTCKLEECPVDGGVGEWLQWEACLQNCAQSTRRRKRLCDNPKPSFYGAECLEKLEEIVPCPIETPCPIDFKWSEWSPWSGCSVTCGEGDQTRLARCTPPQHGGKACPEQEKKETQKCKAAAACPVDFKFLEFGPWSACSVTCGKGEQSRVAKCEPPKDGGKPCPEPEKKETQECSLAPCPANGAAPPPTTAITTTLTTKKPAK